MAFAVILVFMELGLLGGVGRTATMLFDKLNFDLLITSSEYLDMSRPGGVPALAAIAGASGSGSRRRDPAFGRRRRLASAAASRLVRHDVPAAV